MKTMAHIFSTVFQPLLMPIYGIALLFVYTHFQYTYSRSFWQIMFPVFLFSFALPSISIFVMYKLKLVSDLFFHDFSLLSHWNAVLVFDVDSCSYRCDDFCHHHHHLVEDQRTHVWRRKSGGWCDGSKLFRRTDQFFLFDYDSFHFIRFCRNFAFNTQTAHSGTSLCRLFVGICGYFCLYRFRCMTNDLIEINFRH